MSTALQIIHLCFLQTQQTVFHRLQILHYVLNDIQRFVMLRHKASLTYQHCTTNYSPLPLQTKKPVFHRLQILHCVLNDIQRCVMLRHEASLTYQHCTINNSPLLSANSTACIPSFADSSPRSE